jgi:type IV pilus assembly protein PilB
MYKLKISAMKKRIEDRPFGQILKQLGVITDEEVDKALKIQSNGGRGTLFGKILINLGYINEQDIVRALNAQYRFPYLPISDYQISRDVISIIPEALIRQFNIVPVEKIGNVMTVAMENPLQANVIYAIAWQSGLKVQVILTTLTEINKTIEKYFDGLDNFPLLPHDKF